MVTISVYDNFYLSQDDVNQSCLLALRATIMNLDSNVSETLKWGMPCFMYKKKIFCYLSIDRKINEPYILMVEGKYLDHLELEKGNRSRMKIFRVNPNEDLPVDVIESLLNTALDLYRNGIINC